MNTIQVLDVLHKRAQKLAEDVALAKKNAERDMLNIRLARKEVADLLGYDRTYLYRIQPEVPFDRTGHIRYNDLKEYVDKHKPGRIKRLKENFKQYIA